MKISLTFLYALIPLVLWSQETPALIPYPQKIELAKENFQLSTSFKAKGDISQEEINTFNYFLPQNNHFIDKAQKSSVTVVFKKIEGKNFPENYYSLETLKKNGDPIILIDFTNEKAKFYAFQTLRQLLYTAKDHLIPILTIEDFPKLEYRGMHLDVVRHFFTKDEVKKYLDFLAMYKFDKFHWHLTDDQGWRIEIKKYPKLTSVGAWRNSSQIGPYSDLKFDDKTYGGFYTQQDIKEVVAYAKKLHIDVIPEIEMPGHSLAAIAAYPELSCANEQVKITGAWGVEENILCPTEYTFDFYQNVLEEVMQLFPYEYIHIGGDEAPKEYWKKSPFVQNLMKELHLKNEDEVQSYFIKRIEKYLNSKGKKIIGWDEILEGGVAPNATIMSWRGIAGGIAAAKSHHKAIMTPGETNYFDHYQGDSDTEPIAFGGDTRLEKVYHYIPIPKELSPQESKYIWGTQANLWTEYILDFNHVQYMLFPRLLALSEVAWGTAKPGKYEAFENRVISHFKILDTLGINYSKAIYEVVGKARAENGKIIDELYTTKNPQNIRYSLDGSTPTLQANSYQDPLIINNTTTVKATYFDKGKQMGPIMTQEFFFSKSTGKPITLAIPPDKAYAKGGASTLVDGIMGSERNYGKNWLGFQGNDVSAIIYLGVSMPISSVTLGILERQGSWIYFPKSIKILISDDGQNFKEVQSLGKEEIINSQGKVKLSFPEQKARFVKSLIENAGIIPDGLQGAGNKAWLFVDEIAVD